MTESNRLLIRPMQKGDETAFLRGVADQALRINYGFPKDMDDTLAARIFHQFSGLNNAFSLIAKDTQEMIGFLLDVPPELPKHILDTLNGDGRTLAFAVFAPYRRYGYMKEALTAFCAEQLKPEGLRYVHCGYLPFNEASRALLQSLGFRPFAEHQSGGALIVDTILERKKLPPR